MSQNVTMKWVSKPANAFCMGWLCGLCGGAKATLLERVSFCVLHTYANLLIRLSGPEKTEPPLCTVSRMSRIIFSFSAFIRAIQAAGAAVCGSYSALQLAISTRDRKSVV